jgi:hypothetical protein
VQQPAKFELASNLEPAKALDRGVLARADEAIE